jgi:hypothetical protein
MSLDSSESIAMQEAQREVCRRFGATFLQPRNDDKLGVALHTLSVLPLNGLRHPITEGTSGWYVWGGGEPGDDPEFFAPLHIAHLSDACRPPCHISAFRQDGDSLSRRMPRMCGSMRPCWRYKGRPLDCARPSYQSGSSVRGRGVRTLA